MISHTREDTRVIRRADSRDSETRYDGPGSRPGGRPHRGAFLAQTGRAIHPELRILMIRLLRRTLVMSLCDRLEESLATGCNARFRLLDAVLHGALTPAGGVALEQPERVVAHG